MAEKRRKTQTSVALTRRQIEISPSIDAHNPVSRQQESEYYRHYGWPVCDAATPMMGAGMTPPVMGMMGTGGSTRAGLAAGMAASGKRHEGAGAARGMHLGEREHEAAEARSEEELRLCSVQELLGYGLHAVDGDVGKVTGVLMDDQTWEIREVCVDAGHWFGGQGNPRIAARCFAYKLCRLVPVHDANKADD